MKTNEFDYILPKELIAQHPSDKRSESKLMAINVNTNEIKHHIFKDIKSYLKEGDVLVVNNTKVIPARLYGYKEKTNAKIEVLILKIENNRWECMVKNAKAVKINTTVIFDEKYLSGTCVEVKEEGLRVFEMKSDYPLMDVLYMIGKIPLPPYIKQTNQDVSRYQTVYAQKEGSSAAPTAGLHFSEALIDELKDNGILFVDVTLHIGLGTFKPVEVDDITNHKMHSEYYEISKENAEIIQKAKNENRRIIAVGTTSARVLETVASKYDKIVQDEGYSEIFIYPGYSFKAIDALITNFHLPKSTLLMMISAFAGLEFTKQFYQLAVQEKYRFFSFGDSMFLYR
mgnify:CR=1 FL=1